MINNIQNSLALVVFLSVSCDAYAGRWVNWDPVLADISYGINTMVETVVDIKKTFMGKKKKAVSADTKEDHSEHDETPQSKSVSVVGIDVIKVSGAGLLIITQDATKSESFVIECAEDSLSDLDIRVENNTLAVVLKNDDSLWSKKSVVYQVNIATLSRLDVTDKVSVEFCDVNVATLSVKASGNSKVSGIVSANELRVNSSDAGGVVLSGSAHTQVVKISGNGIFDGRNLDGKTIAIDGTEKAYLYCNVSDIVAGSLSDSGSLVYAGSPVVDLDSSQGASVKKL